MASAPPPSPGALEDDFSAFAGSEHMFFGLRDPFAMMREDVESTLRRQIADTELLSIAIVQKPKFLTLGRKSEDGEHAIVTHFGFCARARLTVLFDERRKGELIEVTLTYLFGNVDTPNAKSCRSYFDLHADADSSFEDSVFKQRFLAFRAEATRA